MKNLLNYHILTSNANYQRAEFYGRDLQSIIKKVRSIEDKY